MRRLLPILLLAGCSSGATGGGTSTLAPLPATDAPIVGTLPGEDVGLAPEQFAFLDDALYYNNGPASLSQTDMLWYGNLWCELMQEGMEDTDVVERINEGGTDDFDRRLHFAIVLSAIGNLCPNQEAKAEYIALNMPLP